MEKWYPANLRLEGKVCTVVGGGKVAERRVLDLLNVGAKVRVIAPEATMRLEVLAKDGKLDWRAANFSAPLLVGSFLVVCATNDATVNRAAAWVAKATGALVNMAAPPLELGDFSVPAVAHNDNLMVMVSTEGLSPELAKYLIARLREKVTDVYGPWLKRLAPIHDEIKATVPDRTTRKRLWAAIVSDEIMELVRAGDYDTAETLARKVLEDAKQ